MVVKLGQTVRDRITGFEGVAIARTIYLTGCDHIGIQPPIDKEGKIPDAQWIDERKLEVMDVVRVAVDDDPPKEKPKRGGPQGHNPPTL